MFMTVHTRAGGVAFMQPQERKIQLWREIGVLPLSAKARESD
jgi:hypothetical protein